MLSAKMLLCEGGVFLRALDPLRCRREYIRRWELPDGTCNLAKMKFAVVVLFMGLVAVCQAQFQFRNQRRFRGSSRHRPITFPGNGGNGNALSPGAHLRSGNTEYHLSWLVNKRHLSGGSGVSSHCSSLGSGWKPVSIDNPRTNSFITGLLRDNNEEYIWTGGQRKGNSRIFVWPTGRDTRSFSDWSRTGGNRVPQPDNRDAEEICLAVLNNVYHDGIKWHDVKCSHKKPTVCERRL